MHILRHIKQPEHFEVMGLNSACGVLLYGAPGCGNFFRF